MKKIKLTNAQYDTLKEITTIWLPALGTLYFTLSGIWGFPYSEAIVGTITAIVTFFGAVLKASTKNYRAERVQNNFNSESIVEMSDEGGIDAEADYTA